MVGHMTNTRRRAIFQLEAIVALGTMIFIVSAMTAAILTLARSSHALIARQQATLAAETLLNDIRDGDAPTAEEFGARFHDMEFRIDRTPATGDFAGFDRATVHVDVFTHGRKSATVRLCGFVMPEDAR